MDVVVVIVEPVTAVKAGRRVVAVEPPVTITTVYSGVTAELLERLGALAEPALFPVVVTPGFVGRVDGEYWDTKVA